MATDKFFDTMLHTSLKHMLDHAQRADTLARMVYELILAHDAQPDINECLEELRSQGYIDDNYEWRDDEQD